MKQSRNATDYQTWMCLICGWIYDEEAGLPGRRHRPRDPLGRRADELDLPGMRRPERRLRDDRDLKCREIVIAAHLLITNKYQTDSFA